MGKTDRVLYNYLSDKVRFADLFNGSCFGGKRIIRPGELEQLDGRYMQQEAGRKEGHIQEASGSMKERDLLMLYKDRALLRLLAVENQTQVDYTMPWRCMNYDAKEYEKQIKRLCRENRNNKELRGGAEYLCGFKKEDRLIPVFTLCVYYGEETWDGPRSLRDMMVGGHLVDEWDSWFRDYSMNLICVNEWQDKDRFHTSLRQVFGALPCRKDKNRLWEVMREDPAYSHLDGDTYRVLAVLLGEKKLIAQGHKEEKEEWDMCKALEDIRLEGFEEGIQRGIEQGIDQGKRNKTRLIVRNMLQHGMAPEDIISLAECSKELIEEVRREV